MKVRTMRRQLLQVRQRVADVVNGPRCQGVKRTGEAVLRPSWTFETTSLTRSAAVSQLAQELGPDRVVLRSGYLHAWRFSPPSVLS